jgi:glutamate N-acetyltransferase / amino-acid N-acetyltransferase
VPAAKRRFLPKPFFHYPKGYLVSGTWAGVKPANLHFPDLTIITSNTPASAAAVFTTNKCESAWTWIASLEI